MSDLREKRVELILQQLEELPTLPGIALKVLEATAEYKLDRTTLGKIDAKAAKDEVNTRVRLAVEAQSGTEIVEREGAVFVR